MDGEHAYMGWYRNITRFIIGNPIHHVGSRFIPYAERHEALMQQHTGEGATALHDYGQ